MATDNSTVSPMNEPMDFMPRPSAAFAAAFEAVIDVAMQAENTAQQKRGYLGASRLGEECLRKLGYEFHHTPKDEGREFSGRTLRIFERGHTGEDNMARRLRLAGFKLVTHRPDGEQIGFGTIWSDDRKCFLISGHIDGVITGVEPGSLAAAFAAAYNLKFPALWENKVLGDKSHKDTGSKGVRASKPVYFVQMQLYEVYLGLADNPGLFTAENGNDGAIYAELVPVDVGAAQAASDKGVRVVTSRDPEELPRIASKSTDFRCKLCDYPGRCWAQPERPVVDYGTTWAGFGARG